MANYTNEIRVMMEKVLIKLMEYERKGFKLKSVPMTITFNEWMLIKHVANSEAVSIAGITKTFGMDRGLISTYLNKFLKNNILIKVKSEEDKRFFVIELTHIGEKLYKEMMEKEDKILEFLLEDVTINEEKGVLKYLSKITQLTVGKHQVTHKE